MATSEFCTKYDISEEFGFLRPHPVSTLPGEFKIWNDLVNNIPELLENKTLRSEVEKLPVLDASSLATTEELHCAHTCLAFLCQSYVWQNGKEGVPSTLPRPLAVPLAFVSDKLGFPSGICYPSLILSNWKMIDPNGKLTYDNVALIAYFQDRLQSDVLFKSTWNVEMEFGPALKWLVQGLAAAKSQDLSTLTKCISEISKAAAAMKDAFAVAEKDMVPDVLYDKVSPYLAGWGVPGGPLPEGLVFDGVSKEPRKLLLRTNASQSSIFQTLDAFLGLEHDSLYKEKHRRLREYMPGKHAELIEYVKTASHVRSCVEKSRDNVLQAEYIKAVESVKAFREYHREMVAQLAQVEQDRQLQGPFRGAMKYLVSLRDSTTAGLP